MYTFIREIFLNTDGKRVIRDHFQMNTGEKRILSNGVIQEDIKTGHVEKGMLQDREFGKAYAEFVKTLPDNQLSDSEMEIRAAERAVAEEAAKAAPEDLINVLSGEGQVSGEESNEG